MFSFSIWLFLLIMVSMLVFSFDFLYFLSIHSVVRSFFRSFVRPAGMSDGYLPPFPCHNHFCICSLDHFHFHFYFESILDRRRERGREKQRERIPYLPNKCVCLFHMASDTAHITMIKTLFRRGAWKGMESKAKTKTASENENEMNKTKQLKNNCLGRNCNENRTSTRNCAQRKRFFCRCVEKITMRKWSENKRPT